jgi:DNA repair exonuclease SbcCD ATPase subunit
MKIIELRATNFCCFESISQQLDKQGLVWVSGENRDTQSANNNGSGKSTLSKALTWGLYGLTLDGEKGDKVIRSGEKTAIVEVVLQDGDEIWTVKRTRKKGQPRLELIQPDEKPYSASKGGVQDKVIEMIGLDFPAFKNTILFGQNDVARFADVRTKDAQRKEMLHRILRTGILHHCHELALERRRGLKREVSEIEKSIASAQQTLAVRRADRAEIKDDKELFEKGRKHKIKTELNSIEMYKERAQAFMKEAQALEEVDDDATDEIQEFEKSVLRLNAQADEAVKNKEKLNKMNKKIDSLRSKQNDAHQRTVGLMADLRVVKESLKALDGDTCPTCSSPLDEGAGYARKEQLVWDETHISERLSESRQGQVELGKMMDARQKSKLDLESKSHAASYIKEAAGLEKQIDKLKYAAMKKVARIEALGEKANDAIDLARSAVNTCKRIRAEENPFVVKLKRLKAEIYSAKKRIQGLIVKMKGITVEMAHVDFWVRGFSNQGLPSYILDSVMPYVADRANHYLDTLSDGDITMEFTTQREKKSAKNEYRDEIHISWEIEGVEDSYPPSGGQLKKMEIATDLALMDLVATREGNSVDLLILDEVLDGLDAEGRQRVLLLLNEMRSRRGSIFVISHEAEVAEIFEKAVYVVKENGVSELKVVA